MDALARHIAETGDGWAEGAELWVPETELHDAYEEMHMYGYGVVVDGWVQRGMELLIQHRFLVSDHRGQVAAPSLAHVLAAWQPSGLLETDPELRKHMLSGESRAEVKHRHRQSQAGRATSKWGLSLRQRLDPQSEEARELEEVRAYGVRVLLLTAAAIVANHWLIHEWRKRRATQPKSDAPRPAAVVAAANAPACSDRDGRPGSEDHRQGKQQGR